MRNRQTFSGSWHATVRTLFLVLCVAGCQPAAQEQSASSRQQTQIHLFTEQRQLGERPWQLLTAMANSRVHGRDPATYLTPDLIHAIKAASSGSQTDLKAAETQLTRAFIRWAYDLDTPRVEKPIETDQEATVQPFSAPRALRAAANAPDFTAHLDSLQQRHPLYNALAKAMLTELAEGRDIDRLSINLERARALPAEPTGKHIIVDAAGARLWMFEGKQRISTMKVVTGRPAMPTPLMSGVIRYVVTQPYWNIPEDIVRDRIAPAVLRKGPAIIADQDLEMLADWAPDAKSLAATAIDWRAVAAGKRPLRVRQRPGPGNMMGRIKFMLPNDLGIYLHDTPKVQDFTKASRANSSGCVRVENAPHLARWLFDGADPLANKAANRSLTLPAPVPVYISYFTISPEPDKPVRNPDIYGRDKPRQLSQARGQVSG